MPPKARWGSSNRMGKVMKTLYVSLALAIGITSGALALDSAPPASAQQFAAAVNMVPTQWHGQSAPTPGCSAYQSFRSANNGSIAMVRKCRNSTGTTVQASGYIEDLSNNGACGMVHVKYNGYTGTDVFGWACPKGNVDYFTGSYRTGTNIDVYVYDVLV